MILLWNRSRNQIVIKTKFFCNYSRKSNKLILKMGNSKLSNHKLFILLEEVSSFFPQNKYLINFNWYIPTSTIWNV